MKKSLQIWMEAARPKTLPLAIASITTGSALAFANGHFSPLIAILALTTALLLQILSNLANDYGDALKGTDNEQRIGPQRAMQTGAVSAKQMKHAIIFNITLTILSGLILILSALSSWQSIITFIGLGVLAIIAAIGYTMGNKPYGYLGLGDLSVLIFFGLLGVSGTFFLHTGNLSLELTLPAIGSGLLAVAVLNINNMRDIENDKACGKQTIAVRLGEKYAKHYHTLLLSAAMVSMGSYLAMNATAMVLLLPFIAALWFTAKHGYAVLQTTQPIQIAPMLPIIVKCALLSNLLFAIIVVAQTMTS